MFNHLCLQGKCTYVTFVYHILLRFQILYQPVVGIFGKFPNWHLFRSKFWLLIGNLQATIEILISAQPLNQIYFSKMVCAGYLEISPLAPFYAAIYG